MNFIARGFAAFAVVAAASGAAFAAEPRFALPVAPRVLVEDGAAFAPFCRDVADAAERLLPATPPADVARLKLLLAIQVHVALHFHDGARALDSAARIRALQVTEAERAFAGLTTRAHVAVHRRTSADVPPARFAAAFGEEFRALLATLPASAEMRAVLATQRERLAGITADALRAEAARLDAELRGARTCSLAQADQIIRMHHRLHDIVPLRAELLAALDSTLQRYARP